MQTNMHEAKSKLSQLVELAVKGDEVVIAKSGKPVVKLVPYTDFTTREFGQLKDKIKMSDDFDSVQTNAEIAELFE